MNFKKGIALKLSPMRFMHRGLPDLADGVVTG